MSDTPLFRPEDGATYAEALLRELDESDFVLVTPPADIWVAIDAALAQDADWSVVVPLDRRRPSRPPRLLGVAAAVVAIVAAGMVVLSSSRSGGGETTIATARLVHEASFDPLGAGAAGNAALVDHDGVLEISLEDTVLPDPETADLELWLIAAEADGSLDVRPVSLVDADSPGTYAVPAGLDPAVYSIVDISVEPRDGDATHSGRSILRGAFTDV